MRDMDAFCDEPTAVPQVIDKGDENEGMKMKEKNDADSIEATATASRRTVAHYAFTARAVRRPSRSTSTVPTNDLPSRPAQRRDRLRAPDGGAAATAVDGVRHAPGTAYRVGEVVVPALMSRVG